MATPPKGLGLDALMPGLFVLLWSTGFIGTKYVINKHTNV